jgi:hypothetical protein
MSSEAHDTGKEVDGTQVDKVNAGALGTLVAVGLLAMISITAAVTALVRHDIEVEESDKAADANQVVISLKDAQRGDLNAPAHYADRKGTVALPIDLAKADAGSTAATATESPDAGAKAEPASKEAEPKPAPASSAKPGPAASAKPALAPSAAPATRPLPTPTAATPGAESPGPVNH